MKKHFSMRMGSDLFEQVQKYAALRNISVTAVVEDAVKRALPDSQNDISCKIKVLDQGNGKSTITCELFVPKWSHIERWEKVVPKEMVGRKEFSKLAEYASEWAKRRLNIDSLEVTLEDENHG